MTDQSEITLGVGVAPMSVEHEGGRRKGRSKSREPSRAREDLGDLEKHLARVELHLVDGEEKFEEMDTHLVELYGRIEEFQGEIQGALNVVIDKLASEGHGKVKGSRATSVSYCYGRGMRGVATASGASLVIPLRVEVSKPSVYSGARNANEIDNFLSSLEQYFRAIGITDDARRWTIRPCIWWILQWFGGDGGTVTWRKGFAPLPHRKSSRESSRGNFIRRIPRTKQGPN
ncbi:hypothetical protein GH714_013660 [Hevea brasiliensis]|uniref:Uncharacterized protein n=1 Tax=Hevea brasiliensis TaxID=3981 RepID=A0A6A6LKA5_HEVBR|nr:hypothetical protein GH714_013660 [Hevea brasiliensis]